MERVLAKARSSKPRNGAAAKVESGKVLGSPAVGAVLLESPVRNPALHPVAIASKWKRFMAVGCYHSQYACRQAASAILGFRDRWKPDTVIDLGDVHDFTAFRTGAKGTKDEFASVELDFSAGVEWLKAYRPTHRCKGNHDNRIDRLIQHPSAIVAHSAGCINEALRKVDEENETIVKPYHMRDGWFQLGDTKFGHGWMYNEMAIRDHAEAFGKCVIAHLHSSGTMRGRNIGAPQAWCVGTIGDPDRFDYAQERRNTLRWNHGMVFGEYSDKECHIWLVEQDCNHGGPESWRMPL